jgi:glycosyltransferase involved in cell wall biosynthesis
MKLAFVDINDPTDPGTWSGIPSRMIEGLSRYAEVDVVSNLGTGVRQLYGGHKLYYKLAGKRFDEHRTGVALRLFSYRIKRALRRDIDAVVAPGSIAIALPNFGKPAAFWTDSCFAAMPGYYDTFSRLSARSLAEGHAQEKSALEHCRLAIYSSNWAAETARRYYPESAHKVYVVPFGANLDPRYDFPRIQNLVANRSAEECRLLFVGVDWVRKGGDTVLAAAQIMAAEGQPTKLTIVGCDPFGSRGAPPFVDVVGFLSGRSEQDREKLNWLFQSSHFLVLPSAAEAYGIVLCEAAAYALPSVASRTGGISDIIDDGITGELLPEHADGRQYAETLMTLFRNQERYRTLAMAAFDKYRKQLNWDVACKTVVDRLQQVL